MSGIPDPQQRTPTNEGVLPPTEPIPELQKLGTTLAAARHQSGIDLEMLAERLRIGASQLRALETGDHTHLPEGVFVIALARRVASALDVNIDESVKALRGSRLMLRPQPRPSLPPAPLRCGKPPGSGACPCWSAPWASQQPWGSMLGSSTPKRPAQPQPPAKGSGRTPPPLAVPGPLSRPAPPRPDQQLPQSCD